MPYSARQHHANRYKARKAARLCVSCAAGLQLGDGIRCVECRDRQREYDRSPAGAAATARKRAKRRAKGQCFDCSQPAAPGRERCERHLADHAAWQSEYLDRKEAAHAE